VLLEDSAAQQKQGDSAALLRSIAEQLTSPLTVISREAELASLSGSHFQPDAAVIHTQATAALTLVESYLLGLQLADQQIELTLEPVSVSSLLVDVAHELHGFAKQYDAALEVRIAGRYEPVMAHMAGLKSALLAVGYALLEGHSQPGKNLTLAVHRTPHGIVTGLYGDFEAVTSDHWDRALRLHGAAAQSFSAICKGSGAGLFIANTILQAMATRLRVGRHQNMQGLATTLRPSQQLQFV
jgi:K+-sensing histidine kinase KdpD